MVPCPAELALACAYSLVVCAVCAFASPVCGCLACEEVFEPGEHFCGGCVVGSWGDAVVCFGCFELVNRRPIYVVGVSIHSR